VSDDEADEDCNQQSVLRGILTDRFCLCLSESLNGKHGPLATFSETISDYSWDISVEESSPFRIIKLS
jgi:hypothetical protein